MVRDDAMKNKLVKNKEHQHAMPPSKKVSTFKHLTASLILTDLCKISL